MSKEGIFVMVSNNNEIVSYGLLNEGKYDSVNLNETRQENEIYSRGGRCRI